jgi:hypothetical protein
MVRREQFLKETRESVLSKQTLGRSSSNLAFGMSQLYSETSVPELIKVETSPDKNLI